MADVDDFSEEDCDAESEGEDAEQLLAESAAGREEGEEDDWEPCHITTDQRDAEGIRRVYGGLTRALNDDEDVHVGLFLRFFPLHVFADRFAQVSAHYRANRTTRHNVPFNRGMFLRFIGLLIRMVT